MRKAKYWISVNRHLRPALAFCGLSLFLGAVATASDEVFATVGDVGITYHEFEREVYQSARQTFYHGQPQNESDYLDFRRGVADRLIDRVLILNEARRRGLTPDHEAIAAELDGYERRYGNTERWQREGSQMIASVRQRLEENSLVEALEADVRGGAPAPDDPELRAYYSANPELFTEPARHRVSLILLGVEPSALPATWSAAMEEADRVVERARSGTDFGELAYLHSSDSTAELHGDMGYVHAGMLGPTVEATIAALEIGEVSEPVRVLEGVAIFKLTGRTPAALRPFEDVQDRARDLREREQAQMRWEQTLAELREAASIEVDTAYLSSLPHGQR